MKMSFGRVNVPSIIMAYFGWQWEVVYFQRFWEMPNTLQGHEQDVGVG